MMACGSGGGFVRLRLTNGPGHCQWRALHLRVLQAGKAAELACRHADLLQCQASKQC